MNFCERLVKGVLSADSIDVLIKISDRADEAFFRADEKTRALMTDDFWIEFTKVIRKRVIFIRHQEQKQKQH
jgi:hypothetical protein